MWEALNVIVASGQSVVVVESSEGSDWWIRAHLQEICDAQDPKRTLLSYTPLSGLAESKPRTKPDEEDAWIPRLPSGSNIGQVSEYLRTKYQLPCLVWLQDPDQYWGGDGGYVFRNLANAFEREMKTLVLFVPPGAEVPEQIKHYSTVLQFPRPDARQLSRLLAEVADENEILRLDPLLAAANSDMVVTALRGLTYRHAVDALMEAETFAAMHFPDDMVKEEGWQRLAKYIREWKSRQAVAAGRISLVDVSKVHAVGGFWFLMEEIDDLKSVGAFEVGHPDFLNGIAVVGPPGTGKSYVAMVLAQRTGIPLYKAEKSKMVGRGVVGDKTRQFRGTFDDAKTVAPCYLLFDEAADLLSGSDSSHKSDSGETATAVAEFLTFVQDEAAPNGVIPILTMNDLGRLRAQDLRAGRMGMVVRTDLPDSVQRSAIVPILLEDALKRRNQYQRERGRQPITVSEDVTLDWLVEFTDGFVGSEIELLIKNALRKSGYVRLERASFEFAMSGMKPMSKTKRGRQKLAEIEEDNDDTASVHYGSQTAEAWFKTHPLPSVESVSGVFGSVERSIGNEVSANA